MQASDYLDREKTDAESWLWPASQVRFFTAKQVRLEGIQSSHVRRVPIFHYLFGVLATPLALLPVSRSKKAVKNGLPVNLPSTSITN